MLNVVIIGASNAGHGIASKLTDKLPATHRVLIIDPAPTAYWPIASLRAAVQPGWENKVYHTLEQEKLFPKGSRHLLLKHKVTSLEKGSVVIDGEFEGSSSIAFDSLIFATGSSQPFPQRPKQEWSASTIEEHFRVMQGEIKEAKNIVILGGGPTGIEFAGEVLNHFKEDEAKKITIVHRNPALIDSRAYPKFAQTLENKLRALKVDLVLGDEHVASPEFKTGKQGPGSVVKTKGGKELEADWVFLAVGNTPNTGLLRGVDSAALTAQSLIKVNDYLQVQSSFFTSKNIFAAGDCADSPGWRSAISVDADAATVAANVIAASSNAGLKKHKAGPRVMVVPLGPTDGAGFAQVPLLGDSMLPEFLVPKIKGKDLFTEKFHQRFLA